MNVAGGCVCTNEVDPWNNRSNPLSVVVPEAIVSWPAWSIAVFAVQLMPTLIAPTFWISAPVKLRPPPAVTGVTGCGMRGEATRDPGSESWLPAPALNVLAYMYVRLYFAFMPPRKRPAAVREPVQVYLAPDDSALLNRLSESSGLSKAEILRRGVRAFAREQQVKSPMMEFIESLDARGFRAGDAIDHDRVLTDMYLEPLRKKR